MTVNETLYLINVLSNFDFILTTFFVVSTTLLFITMIFYFIDKLSNKDDYNRKLYKKSFKKLILTSFISGIIGIFSPDEKVMYVMAANTYLGSEIPIKVKQVIIKKLDGYLNESK